LVPVHTIIQKLLSRTILALPNEGKEIHEKKKKQWLLILLGEEYQCKTETSARLHFDNESKP